METVTQIVLKMSFLQLHNSYDLHKGNLLKNKYTQRGKKSWNMTLQIWHLCSLLPTLILLLLPGQMANGSSEALAAIRVLGTDKGVGLLISKFE